MQGPLDRVRGGLEPVDTHRSGHGLVGGHLARDVEELPAEVRADVEAVSGRELQRRSAGTAWLRCDSWYRDDAGRVVTNWPGYVREYRRRTARLDPAEFVFR